MKHHGSLRWSLVGGLLLAGCLRLESLRAVGPVVELKAPVDSIEATAGQEISVSAQALDVNGVGVDGAWVTFTRADDSRVAWLDGPTGADAVTEKTSTASIAAVTGAGVAIARAKVPSDAPLGDATVFAVLKGPADDTATLTARITVHVTVGPDGGLQDAAATDGSDQDGAAGAGGQSS